MHCANRCPQPVEPWKLTSATTCPGAANACAFQRACRHVQPAAPLACGDDFDAARGVGGLRDRVAQRAKDDDQPSSELFHLKFLVMQMIFAIPL